MLTKECCEKLKPYAAVFLRLGLGIIFTYRGFGKVLGTGTDLGMAWDPNLSAVLQPLVAWGELLSGLAILSGFFVELGAAIIIIIMVGAIVLVRGKNGFNIMNGGFEYDYALIMMALALISTGAGPLGIGCGCFGKKETSKS